MSELQANNPGEAAPTAAEPELAPAPEQTTEPASEEQPEGQATTDELEEAEYEGRKHPVPKGWKDALLRQSDYTRKTQEIADKAREVETERAAVTKQREAVQNFTKELGEFYSLHAQVQQYEKVDWQKWGDSDPVAAQKAWFQFQTIKDQRQSLAQNLSQQDQQRQLEAQRDHAKRVDEGRRAIAKDIPGWNDELANKLKDTVTTHYGFTAQEWANVTDPRAVKVLHDAWQYRQLLAKQRAATPQQPPVAPIPQVGGQRSPTTDLRALAARGDMSDFSKAFRKQRAGPRAR